MASHVQDYSMRLILGTHPGSGFSSEMTDQYVRYGSSPRGGQALILAGKVKSLLDRRFNFSFADIQSMAKPALRHRLSLNFEGESENISQDKIIEELLQKIPVQSDSHQEKTG